MKISNYKLQGDKCEIANIKRKFLIKPKKKEEEEEESIEHGLIKKIRYNKILKQIKLE